MRDYTRPAFPSNVNGIVFNQIDWQDDEPQPVMAEFDKDAVDQLTENMFREPALYTFVEHCDDRARAILKKHLIPTAQDQDMPGTALNAPSALRELTSLEEGGVGYAAQIVEAQRLARADLVRGFLRAMKNDKLREPLGRVLGDIEKLLLTPDSPIAQTFGRYAIEGTITVRDHYRVEHEALSAMQRRGHSESETK